MKISRIIYTLELTMIEGYDIISVNYKIVKRNNWKMIMVLNYKIRKNILMMDIDIDYFLIKVV